MWKRLLDPIRGLIATEELKEPSAAHSPKRCASMIGTWKIAFEKVQHGVKPF